MEVYNKHSRWIGGMVNMHDVEGRNCASLTDVFASLTDVFTSLTDVFTSLTYITNVRHIPYTIQKN